MNYKNNIKAIEDSKRHTNELLESFKQDIIKCIPNDFENVDLIKYIQECTAEYNNNLDAYVLRPPKTMWSVFIIDDLKELFYKNGKLTETDFTTATFKF